MIKGERQSRMKKRILGKQHSLTVSAVGMGCMGFSHGYGPGPERSEAIELIRTAYEMGCTFFDTAEGYADGENEELVGEAVKPFRHHIVLATKLHIPEEGDVETAIRSHLEASLKRLGTDYVDLYYQHRVSKKISVEEVAGVMGKLIDEGMIRGWGQSQATEEQLRRAHAVTPITAIQSEYSMMERMFEKDVIPACQELGIGFVPFSPLGAGFLSGQYHSGDSYTGDDVRRVITRFYRENMEANQPLLDLLRDFAAQKGATPAQIALAWMLHKWDFLVPIPGMRKLKRLKENLGAADVALTQQEFCQLEEQLDAIKIYGNRTDEDIAKLKSML